MNEEVKRQFLNEAIRIGDELLSSAEYDKGGRFWKTMGLIPGSDNDIVWHESESIYSGVSGIALFFIELYKQTKNEEYKNAAVEGMRWVARYCADNPTDRYAFFTGRMGVPYTMIRMFDLTGDETYLEQGLHIAKACTTFLSSTRIVDDLINGTAGTLLGLLHLHAATGEAWIVEAIDTFVGHLLRRAHHGPAGLYWDRSPQHIRGLCGFSHGAAGVGFAFLELGHYFQNEAYYWVAEQAFLYESYFFDESRKNWPDFRKGIYKPGDYEEHEKAFLEGDLAFFTRDKEMNAWCHGAAGIGLSRLRAYERLQNPLYRREAEVAIEKTKITDLERQHSFRALVLCHGASGNAELFLEAYKTLADEQYLSWAQSVALKTLNFKREQKSYFSGYSAGNREDRSLFMGNAGIGYFYLRLLVPDTVPSILMPAIESTMGEEKGSSTPSCIHVSLTAIQKTILAGLFRRTLFILEKLVPEKMETFFDRTGLDSRRILKETFIRLIEEDLLPTLSQRKRAYVADAFTLELEKVRMDEATKSNAWLHIKEEVGKTRAQALVELDDSELLELSMVIAPDVRILLCSWDWDLSQPESWADNLASEVEETPVLLKPSAAGIRETRLTPFVYTVLMAFCDRNQVHSVLQETMAAFEVSVEQGGLVKEAIIQQVGQLLLGGILLEGEGCLGHQY